MEKLDIVVVNLARSYQRRAAMRALLDPLGLPYRFFDAVDGRAEPHPLFSRFDPVESEMRHGHILTPGELGCYASHYLLWEQCVSEDKSLLIFEDDVTLNENFLRAYDAASDRIGKYGVIRFSRHKRRRWVKVENLSSGLDIIRLKIGPHGTSCYAIAPIAAKKLIETAKVWFEPVDCHLDRFWRHGVYCYTIAPPPVIHAAETVEQSEIWAGTARDAPSKRFRYRREIYRVYDKILRFMCNIRYFGRWRRMPK
ncbi:glycosyltransferase family 25 protein [Agrobacterium sp. SORGH_AS 787]|uniref:glycosyltransferase family 25 protein n=1 Tax=Agrobacterium sp. SORGH_AS 787 TaxID=3041775 RepID=UPI0032B87443